MSATVLPFGDREHPPLPLTLTGRMIVFAECFGSIRGVEYPDTAEIALALHDRLTQGIRIQTCNYHLIALKSFCAWLVATNATSCSRAGR